MNRGELRTAIQIRIADQDSIRTTVAEINRLIDDGIGDLAERTGAVVRTDTLAARAGNHFVTLAADCLYPIVMRDAATQEPIDFDDWTAIEKKDLQFVRRDAAYPEMAALLGLAEMLIYPAYQADGQMEIYQAIVPGPLTSDSDEPPFAEQHHQALIYYVHAEVLVKDAHGDLAGPRIGRWRKQMDNYLLMAGAIERWTLDRQGAIRLANYGENLRKWDPSPLREPHESWNGPAW